MEQQWKQGFKMVKPVLETQPKKARKKRNPQNKKLGNIPPLVKVGKPTKTKRKALREEQKQIIKAYSSSDDSKEEVTKDQLDLPSAFKKYTIQDRTILLEKPKRQKPLEVGESYEGPEGAKQVDLAQEGEEPKKVWIATNFTLDKEALLILTLKEYRDVFA